MASTYVIKDNFLNEEDYSFIASHLMGREFPWYYDKNYGGGEKEYPQLCHLFWVPSEGKERFGNTSITAHYYDLLTPLIMMMDPIAVIRIKANCNWKTPKAEARPFHVDFGSIECKTAIYYVNTNNGYTLLRDGTKIESVANRLCIMDSDIQHAAVPSTDTERRVVINLNYHPKPPLRYSSDLAREEEENQHQVFEYINASNR